MEIDRQQFVQLLTAHDLDLPKFWRPPISEPPELKGKLVFRLPLSREPNGFRSSPAGSETDQGAKEAMRRDIRDGQRTSQLSALLEKDLMTPTGLLTRHDAQGAHCGPVEMVEDAMKRDLREGRRTADSLRKMREKGETYGVSLPTSRARRGPRSCRK